jgi:hypothetical protein
MQTRFFLLFTATIVAAAGIACTGGAGTSSETSADGGGTTADEGPSNAPQPNASDDSSPSDADASPGTPADADADADADRAPPEPEAPKDPACITAMTHYCKICSLGSECDPQKVCHPPLDDPDREAAAVTYYQCMEDAPTCSDAHACRNSN